MAGIDPTVSRIIDVALRTARAEPVSPCTFAGETITEAEDKCVRRWLTNADAQLRWQARTHRTAEAFDRLRSTVTRLAELLRRSTSNSSNESLCDAVDEAVFDAGIALHDTREADHPLKVCIGETVCVLGRLLRFEQGRDSYLIVQHVDDAPSTVFSTAPQVMAERAPMWTALEIEHAKRSGFVIDHRRVMAERRGR